MLKSLAIRNLTVFAEANLQFSPQLNVIIGENGFGKSHLLKAAYAVLAASAEEGRQPAASAPTKAVLQKRLADKLVAVLRPESLGRLISRKLASKRSAPRKLASKRSAPRKRCELRFCFDDPRLNIACGFATPSKSEVNIDQLPSTWLDSPPVFLPTRELLTIYPGFVSMYENHYLEFEETWKDTCVLLGAPALRGPDEKRVKELLYSLENAMGGEVELDKNGRFYLRIRGQGRMEMPLVAEGWRKLAMLARLIATGSLLDKGYLFWDEPDANLNPKLIKEVALTILHLCHSGVQVFIATHSLFLLRELHIQLHNPQVQGTGSRFFGLQLGDNGIDVQQGDSIDDIGVIASLDEELIQSDRYLETEV